MSLSDKQIDAPTSASVAGDPPSGGTVADGCTSGVPDAGGPRIGATIAGVGVARLPPASPACLLTVIFSKFPLLIVSRMDLAIVNSPYFKTV
jgi:hypothetical protein